MTSERLDRLQQTVGHELYALSREQLYELAGELGLPTDGDRKDIVERIVNELPNIKTTVEFHENGVRLAITLERIDPS